MEKFGKVIAECIDITKSTKGLATFEYIGLTNEVIVKIYINGVLLDNGDSGWDPKDVNRLDKFVAFMEKFVLAKAFEDSIEEESNDNS